MTRLAFVLGLAALASAACKEADPPASPDAPTTIDADVTIDAPADASPADADPACMPAATDYTPRVMMSATDPYPACVSDADPSMYVVTNASVSTIARIAAFEQIATLLFTPGAPDAQAFIDARIQYSLANGLESRVGRREDEHYPAAPMACNAVGFDPTPYPDRCVGPVRMTPLLADAFTTGATDVDPLARRLAAARIEAGLLWFLYVSAYKESVTCQTTPADCDSSWAYYGGGEHRAGGLGLARYVRGLETATHDRIFDGLLAVRCWRGLDDPGSATDDAMFAALRTTALAQYDAALVRGVASIVRARVVALAAAAGADAAVHWQFVRVLGPALARAAAARNPTVAASYAAELARTDPTAVDAAALITALDTLFPCP
ncbi:MAG: hypothetical protein IPL61_30210 [Myxococcales bacterium]|nr:hypothetical protein [Myxococcales bacterium]